MEELVLDCVMPYIQDTDDLNSVSLVSKKFFDIDSKTRKHQTVYVHYLRDPKRLSHRFPNLESLKIKSFSCSPVITPWIQEISFKFTRLNSLYIQNMTVHPSDLKNLAITRGANLRSLNIDGCNMFSEDGLIDIARYCIDLRSLSLQGNLVEIDYVPNGKWLHELALCNTVMESLDFGHPFRIYDMKDLTRLAMKCSNSLVSLNIDTRSLSDFIEVFKHAKKLEHFGDGIVDEDWIYSGFKFPPNIRGLIIRDLGEASFPFVLPYLNQLRELNLCFEDIEHECQCFLFERCPNLEVLHTGDPCGDEALQVIGQFCKKLRKLYHYGYVTHVGLIALAQGCPNLDYISVRLLDISNEALECVGTHLKNLRVFNIDLEEAVITDSSLDKGVRDVLVGCSKLEKLYIRSCLGGLTDVGLGYIGKYGHNLRDLFLCNAGESDVGFLELLKGCLKLKKLRLGDCTLSENAIATFVFNINQSLRCGWVNRDNVLELTRPEVLTELYVTLAEKLHTLAVQLVMDGNGTEFVEITYISSRATVDLDNPLVRNLVAKGIRNEERSILLGSSEKPLEIIVQIAQAKSSFLIAVEFGDIKLQGRVKDGVPYLTKVGAFEVDVRLDGHILLCRQVDEPNTISRVTSILGEENVNISSMSVNRVASRKQTVMVIGVDKKPSKEALKKIDDIPAVEEFVFLDL